MNPSSTIRKYSEIEIADEYLQDFDWNQQYKCLGTKSLRQQMIVSENGKVIFMGFLAIVSGIDDKCKSTVGETEFNSTLVHNPRFVLLERRCFDCRIYTSLCILHVLEPCEPISSPFMSWNQQILFHMNKDWPEVTNIATTAELFLNFFCLLVTSIHPPICASFL